MALYYHGLGLVAAYGVTFLAEQLDPSYQTPNVSFSLFDAIAAGPVEETLFFGIPFYASSNHYLLLILASVWATIHILNTDMFNFSSLAYGNFLFAAFSLFYSLRTWASGKGWFSIIIHSGWNGPVFALSCAAGEIPCSIVGDSIFYTSAIAATAAILLMINYVLYKESRRAKSISPAIMVGGYNALPVQVAQWRPTAAWYFVPVFLGIIGGVIMYIALRDADRTMAKRGLLVSVLLTIAGIVVMAAAHVL